MTAGTRSDVFASCLGAIFDQPSHRIALRVVGGEQAWSFGRLRDEVERCAAGVERSVEIDGVFVVVEPNASDFIAWFLGGLMAGRWVLPAPPDSTVHELVRFVRESGARSACGSEATRIVEHLGLNRIDPCTTSVKGWDDRGGIVLRTSGTTGVPKLVQRTIASLDAVASNVRGAVGLTADDVVLGTIPAWHSYGVENLLLGPLSAGATVALCDRFDPGRCERALMHDVTVFPAVPMMLESLGRGHVCNGSTLRLAYSAGSSLQRKVADAFERRWGQPVGQLYGATDVGSVTFNDPFSGVGDSVGTAMPGVSVRILDEHHNEVGVGVEGQVAIRAPSMLSRYFGREPLDLIDGHLPMGDLGYLDETGHLTITGMMKFLIDVGGMKVNPLEVEAVLREHPDVADCVVAPLRVSDALCRVRAFVTSETGRSLPDPSVLRGWVGRRLAPYKVPRIIEVRSSLPRSPTGKLLRRELAE